MIIFPTLKGRLKKDGSILIAIKVSHARESVYIPTQYSVPPKYFDASNGMIVKHPDRDFMLEANAKIAELVSRYTRVIRLLGAQAESLPMVKLKQLILANCDTPNLQFIGHSDFYEEGVKLVVELRTDGRLGHAENIQTTISVLERYHGKGKPLPFGAITTDFLRSLRRWYVPMQGKAVTFNKHLRNIKLIFNEARRRKVISRDLYPFDDYSIPSDYDADIRCLNARDVYQISCMDGLGPDMFMLTFYLCGMNMADIVRIPYPKDGYITAQRMKTIRSAKPVKLRLKLHPLVEQIVARYSDPEKKLLIRTPYKSHTSLLRQAGYDLTKKLSFTEIENISVIYARHSWATIAGSLDISDVIIDKGLMHAGRGMIEKYRQFDFSILDRANERIIREVAMQRYRCVTLLESPGKRYSFPKPPRKT